MGTRKATISVPTDPRNLFAKETRDRIAAPSPLFTYAGSSDRKIIIRRFLQLPSHGQRRSRAFLAYTYVAHTQSSCVGKSSSVISPPPPPPAPPLPPAPGSNPNLALSVALACVPGWLRADRISVRVHRGLNDIALFRIERQPVSLLV